MPKVKLDKQYLWSGVTYGPGEVHVPDKFLQAYNLTPIEPPKKAASSSKLKLETETEPEK